jgi:hypothetical protein
MVLLALLEYADARTGTRVGHTFLGQCRECIHVCLQMSSEGFSL